ncbi:BTAD domain-containing putative transcriptional regulator [Kitasatospora sp. NPDC127111]|uniref:BTAD domain-containing putative transcriptional regulator n=1 Tax=Kitasatospora sp. NPDC127111 TaxID=3345363 RepID=UPI00362F77D2
MLGPMEAVDGGCPVALPGGRARVVLAVLALHPGRPVSVARLTDTAWDAKPPATARAQVQAMVSTLRRALAAGDPSGPTLIDTQGAGYRLCADAVETDLGMFQRLVREGRAAAAGQRPAEAAPRLRAALGLWRGPAFDGLPSEPLQAEAARLAEDRLAVLEECLDLELSIGARPDLVAEIRAVVHAHPLRESAYRLLMLALHRAGRTAEALAVFQDARRVLAAELGVEPGAALQQLHQRMLTEDPALLPVATIDPATAAVPPAGPTPAPVRAPLFGRDAELADLQELLAGRRLVTLVGPPGVGKTRLALAAAEAVAVGVRDGVWPVELDAVTDPGLVPAAVAAALGLPAGPGRPLLDAVAAGLATRDTLLVLDNCEHVLEACADLVDSLLTRCRGLRVLATSREPLAVPGETVRLVEPLDLPATDCAEEVLRSAAGRMLADRAAAQVPAFAVTAATAPPVARICRATEGLPLALELVAAQLRTLPVAEVAARLDQQLELLARRRARPARHASLRSAIEWSHRLLTEEERDVFARLSVFAGGFTAEAARAVLGGRDAQEQDTQGQDVDGHGAGAGRVGPVLRDLVDRSLLVAEPDADPARYRLLSAVREFAAERLAAADADRPEKVRRRHAGYYRDFAARVEERVSDGSDVRLRAALRRDLPNLRACLDWALGSREPATAEAALAASVPSHPVPDRPMPGDLQPGDLLPGDLLLGADLVGATAWLWAALPREGLHWVGRALARLAPPLPPEASRRVQYAAGMISFGVDLNDSASRLAEAARLAEGCGDARLRLEALAQLSVVRCLQGRAAEAVAIAEAVLPPVLEHGTRSAGAQVRTALAIAHCGLGELDRARAQLDLAEEVLVAAGATTPTAVARWAQAEVAYYAGDAARAVVLSEAALRDTAGADDLFALVCRRSQHARNLGAAGDRRAGARWLAAVLRECLEAGLWMPAVDALTTAARQEADAGRPERAALLLGGVEPLRERTGRHPAPVELPSLHALRQRLRAGMSDAEHEHAHESGAIMTAEELIRYALAEP